MNVDSGREVAQLPQTSMHFVRVVKNLTLGRGIDGRGNNYDWTMLEAVLHQRTRLRLFQVLDYIDEQNKIERAQSGDDLLSLTIVDRGIDVIEDGVAIARACF